MIGTSDTFAVSAVSKEILSWLIRLTFLYEKSADSERIIVNQLRKNFNFNFNDKYIL